MKRQHPAIIEQVSSAFVSKQQTAFSSHDRYLPASLKCYRDIIGKNCRSFSIARVR